MGSGEWGVRGVEWGVGSGDGNYIYTLLILEQIL